jgi:peptidoglycan-associated lipoprotein
MKNLKLAMAILALITMTACSKTQKKADEGSDTSAAVESVGPISSEALSFNPGGSDTGTIDGLQTVNFPYDSSNLSADARRILADNAEWIKRNSGVSVQVEGHCDARGSAEYNLSLGERRASAVRDYLVNLGVRSNRLSILSYGKEKMLDYADNESAHAKNRRANFVPNKN